MLVFWSDYASPPQSMRAVRQKCLLTETVRFLKFEISFCSELEYFFNLQIFSAFGHYGSTWNRIRVPDADAAKVPWSGSRISEAVSQFQ